MDEKQESLRRRRRMRRRRRIRRIAGAVALLLVLAALGALGYNLLQPELLRRAQQEQTQADVATAAVTRGTIERTVFGSGSVQPASQPGVYATGEATVSVTCVELGDEVRAGDVVMELENAELARQIAEAEYALWEAQEAVEATKTYERYRYEVKLDEETGRPMVDAPTGQFVYERYSNALSIEAPCDGRVMALYIRPGDDALAVYRERGAVALISTDGRMKVELDVVDGVTLELGQTVLVTGTGVRAQGTVVSLVRQGTQAVVQVGSDEYAMNTPVTVTTQRGETVGTGALAINKPMAVSAYGGTIKGVAIKVGDSVKRGDVIAHFTWGGEPLYIDNASVLLDYAKAQAELEALREKQDALVIVAPCDGRVATLDVSAGDSVQGGTKLLSIVEDGAGMTLTLSVDELDVVSVGAGQRAVMALDALPDVTLEGTVEKIAPLGNTGTAVTTYDVTIALGEVDARVMGGMNVSGEIVVETAQDALLIPTDALQKNSGAYCVTMQDGSTRALSVGIVTRDQAQILSGLSEGERVAY